MQKKRIKDLEYQVEELEVYTRKNNVVLYRIPQMENDSPLELAVEIGRAVDIQIDKSDIDTAHRLQTRKTDTKCHLHS